MESNLSKLVILSLHTDFIVISCSKPVLQWQAEASYFEYLKVMYTIKYCIILYVSNMQEQKCKLTRPHLYPAHPLRKLTADTYQVNILRLWCSTFSLQLLFSVGISEED